MVSPVLTDTPETWRNIQTVCETIQRLGGNTNARTGGHIHIGTQDSLGNDPGKLRRVAEICAWSEDLLFRLAANTDGKRRTRLRSRDGTLKHRGAVVGYRCCGPLGRGAAMQSGHSFALNFQHISRQGGGTIEFRHFDGTLDPVRLQQNIKLAVAIVKKAAELAGGVGIPRERNQLGKHRSEGDPQDQLLRDFATFLFADPRDRLGLYSLYVASSWQPSPAQVDARPGRRMRSALHLS